MLWPPESWELLSLSHMSWWKVGMFPGRDGGMLAAVLAGDGVGQEWPGLCLLPSCSGLPRPCVRDTTL